jgi:tripartite-type tricarboxylate transporter receptor subunit TctC
MKLSRRQTFALPLAVLSSAARADTWPSKSVRIVVPSGPGGITDIVARIMAQRLSERLGQSFIIDNRAGAGGIIGTEVVAHAAPDGYTLLMVYPSHPVNPTLKLHLPYDTLRDFAPVTTLTTVSLVLIVTPSLAAQNVQELIALAKRERVTYGTVGTGSLAHLGAALFQASIGIEMVHVPYRSAPAAEAATISGEVALFFDVPITAAPLVRAGKARALGVSTRARLPLFPDVPTIAETVPGYEVLGWNGILAPAATPPAIVELLNRELRAILAEPAIRDKLAQQGADPAPLDVASFQKLVRDDVARWADVLHKAGVQPD